jgi:Fe-S cluster assembly protein SufD
LAQLRAEGLARFGEVGLPTPKLEDWKYTSLAPLAQVPFVPGPSRPDATQAQVEALAGGLDGPQLVFVNGRVSGALSRWTESSRAVLTPFGQVAGERGELLQARLGRDVALGTQPMAALNTALFGEGALVEIHPGAEPPPIHVVFLSSASQPVAAFPRLLVLAGEGCRATVLLSFVGSGSVRSFTDAVVELDVGARAEVTVYTNQQEPENAAHASLLQVSQAQDIRFASHVFALGGAVARDEVRVRMNGTGCACTLNGLYLATGSQHLDQHTLIDHAQPRCSSRELYKGVLDGTAHGVFTGRVLVRPDAQKTDATQTNKNLLLSEHAQVDSRPQLEIFADDVKCTHGSAVGQIDEAALFYLRSRGIDRASARGLLTAAFVSEVVDAVKWPALKLRVQERVASRLGRVWA